MVIDGIVSSMQNLYAGLGSLPPTIASGIRLLFFSIFIALVALIIWKFYQTLSKKNFIVLKLYQYNYSEHPIAKKFFAVFLYMIEYIFIMPVLIILWFVALSAILLLLASDRDVNQLLMLSGAMVMAIRALAYFNEDISKELAKLFPFIAMSIFLLAPSTFQQVAFLSQLIELPLLLGNAFFFFIIILIFEILLRFVYTLSELIKGKESVGDELDD